MGETLESEANTAQNPQSTPNKLPTDSTSAQTSQSIQNQLPIGPILPQDPNIQDQNPNDDSQIVQSPLNIEDQNDNTMALSPGDILKGIPDFDPKSQECVKKFIAQVDLMYLLAPNSNDTIIAVTRAKLVNANKLNSVSDKTWPQIREDIKLKYRTQMTYEVAQEKLLSLQQGSKETLDSYANRVRTLLDALNIVTINDNADIQTSNRTMNENLAVRKFKQNFFNEELRVMAVAADHTNLNDAIAHASSKCEQLLASNLHKTPSKEPDKKEPEPEKKFTPKQTNWKKGKGDYNNKNKNNSNNCAHCKKSNHSSDQCFFRPGGPGAHKTGDNETKNKQTNVATAAAQPTGQPEAVASTSTAPPLPMPSNSINLQPYQYLNY